MARVYSLHSLACQLEASRKTQMFNGRLFGCSCSILGSRLYQRTRQLQPPLAIQETRSEMSGRLHGLKSSPVRPHLSKYLLDSRVHQVAAMPLNLLLPALSLLPLAVQSGFPLELHRALPHALLPDSHLLSLLLFLSLSLPRTASLPVIVSANGLLGKVWQSQMPVGMMR